jgi:hypothetical protein
MPARFDGCIESKAQDVGKKDPTPSSATAAAKAEAAISATPRHPAARQEPTAHGPARVNRPRRPHGAQDKSHLFLLVHPFRSAAPTLNRVPRPRGSGGTAQLARPKPKPRPPPPPPLPPRGDVRAAVSVDLDPVEPRASTSPRPPTCIAIASHVLCRLPATHGNPVRWSVARCNDQ